jgi:SAM-dependent methyltransferase
VYEDRRRAESFGSAAERYDRSRPSYPAALFDEILGPDPSRLDVLDVGCGTGIAARQMTARGANVVGVEVDPRMAAVARSRGVEVEVARIEEWDPAGRIFDRVTAGQSWHWVDPVAGAARAAAVLRPAGRLCLFWNMAQPAPALAQGLAAVYERLAPGTDGTSVALGYGVDRAYEDEQDGIRACSSLTGIELKRFRWSRSYTREQWLDQLPTHSDHAMMEPAQLTEVLAAVGKVIDAAGGAFEMEYSTLLISATRA